MGTLYDTDIVAWSVEQAALLRAGRLSELDLDNLAEEIEDVGKAERRELESRIEVLIMHLLKWRYQPVFRGNSWRRTISTQRTRIVRRLGKTPSLRHEMAEPAWLSERWEDAVEQAALDTGLDQLPAEPLWSVSQILDAQFWPD